MTKEEYQQEYERLYRWRERWNRLSNKHEPGRLQSRQEAIERRGAIANNRILALMRAYDAEHNPAEWVRSTIRKERVSRARGVRTDIKDWRQDLWDAGWTVGRDGDGLIWKPPAHATSPG